MGLFKITFYRYWLCFTWFGCIILFCMQWNLLTCTWLYRYMYYIYFKHVQYINFSLLFQLLFLKLSAYFNETNGLIIRIMSLYWQSFLNKKTVGFKWLVYGLCRLFLLIYFPILSIFICLKQYYLCANSFLHQLDVGGNLWYFFFNFHLYWGCSYLLNCYSDIVVLRFRSPEPAEHPNGD